MFEPSESCFQILQQKFASNPNVEIINKAVSDKPGLSTFYEEEANGETSSLLNTQRDTRSIAKRIVVNKLDKELEERQIEFIDFLKIDTEGFDLRVLKGCLNYLSTQKIGIVQFEYNKPWAYTGSTLFEAIEMLKNQGYEVFLIRGDGLFNFDYALYGDFYSYSNFVGVSKSFKKYVKEIIKY